MFFYFFNEYRVEIFDKQKINWKQVKANEWALLATVILVPVVSLICFNLFFKESTKIILYSITIIFIYVGTFIIGNKGLKKMNQRIVEEIVERINAYEQRTVKPLTALLKKEYYAMYNNKSIKWLINKCDYNIPVPKKGMTADFFKGIVIPSTALAVSLGIQTDVTIGIIIVTVLIFIGSISYFSVWADKIINYEDVAAYRALKEELEYILTLLPEERATSPAHVRICPKCPKAQPKAH